MSKKIGFLTDGDGNPSSMRLGFFILILTVVTISIGALTGWIMGIILNRDLTMLSSGIVGLAGLATGILIPAFGGKAAQSFSENKEETAGEDKE